MKLKLLSLLLIAAMLFSSCGIITINKGTGDDVTEESETDASYVTSYYDKYPVKDNEAEAKLRLDALPNADFSGQSVFIVNCIEAGDIFNDENGSFNRAVYNRNKLVSEKYNCRIVTQQKEQKTAYKEATSADKSGVYYADIAVVPAEQLGRWYLGSHVRNLTSIDHLNLSAEYYNQATVQQMSTKNAVFGTVGDAVNDLRSYYCLYVNKTVLSESGLKLDYGMIKNGGFTWEKLFEMASVTLDGKVAITSAVKDEELSRIGLLSTGQNFLTKDNDGVFSLTCETQLSVDVIGALKTFNEKTVNKHSFVSNVKDEEGNVSEKEITATDFEIFENGKALFSLATVGHMEKLAFCGFDWEVLPLPKASTDQQYYGSALVGSAPIMTVLTNTSDIDTIGFVYEGLNAASYGLGNEFYNAVMRDYATGVYTPDMLDLISQNPMYDFASMFTIASDTVEQGTVLAFHNAVTGSKSLESYFKKNKKTLNNYLKELK